MYDAAGVRVRQRAGQRNADLKHLLVRQTAIGDQLRERTARDEL